LRRVRILARDGIRQPYRAEPGTEVGLVQRARALQLPPQRALDSKRQHRHAVYCAPSVAMARILSRTRSSS
jgi:hypothetical protein